VERQFIVLDEMCRVGVGYLESVNYHSEEYYVVLFLFDVAFLVRV